MSAVAIQTPPLVDADAAAAELGVSRKTLYDAAARGRVRATRMGRLVKFTRAEVERIKQEGFAEDGRFQK